MKIAIAGAAGRMGQMLIRADRSTPRAAPWPAPSKAPAATRSAVTPARSRALERQGREDRVRRRRRHRRGQRGDRLHRAGRHRGACQDRRRQGRGDGDRHHRPRPRADRRRSTRRPRRCRSCGRPTWRWASTSCWRWSRRPPRCSIPPTTSRCWRCTIATRSTRPRAPRWRWAAPPPPAARSSSRMSGARAATAIPARGRPARSASPPCAAARRSACTR